MSGMNKCLHCGKEIAEGRKFCSRSCSASYNNVRRERKPWTEEQKAVALQKSKKTKGKVQWNYEKPKYCKHCGVLLDPAKGERRVCIEHINLGKYKKLVDRIGIVGNSELERFEKTKKFLNSEYFEQKKSLPRIAKDLGVWEVSLRRFFLSEGKTLRTSGESNSYNIQQGLRKVPVDPKYVHGWKESWNGTKIFYRSSYELSFSENLDKEKIPYEVESIRIRYWDSQKGKERTAIPDFYLPQTKELIEIKSSYTYDEQNMKDKFKAYREAGYIPKLVLNGKEMAL